MLLDLFSNSSFFFSCFPFRIHGLCDSVSLSPWVSNSIAVDRFIKIRISLFSLSFSACIRELWLVCFLGYCRYGFDFRYLFATLQISFNNKITAIFRRGDFFPLFLLFLFIFSLWFMVILFSLCVCFRLLLFCLFVLLFHCKWNAMNTLNK